MRKARIITAHPDETSLTVSVAHAIQRKLEAAEIEVSIENLATSGFGTHFDAEDLRVYREFLDGDYARAVSPDVREQQVILESAQALIIVFPIHWWSFPERIKGWMDRVLTGGWSWGVNRSGRVSAMSNLEVHLVPLAGVSEKYLEEEGYFAAMKTQIEQGILRYTHTPSISWHWLWDAARRPIESLEEAEHAAEAIALTLK